MIKAVIAATLLTVAAQGAPFVGAPENDVEHNARRQQEFREFNPQFEMSKAARMERLRELSAEVARREAARQSTACSHQILWETDLADPPGHMDLPTCRKLAGKTDTSPASVADLG